MNKTENKSLKIFLILNITVFVISLLYVIFISPDENGNSSVLAECFFKERLHIYCPGCGGSRSLSALFRLDIKESFILYPPVIISSLVILDYDIRLIINIIRKNTSATDKFKYYTFLFIPISVILNFILKNILLISFGIDLIGDILK